MADLQSVTDKIKIKMEKARGLSARVKFDFGDEGIIHVDTTQSPPVISHVDEDADCTLACSLETFDKILNGDKDPNIAFMMGQLKVRGSMGLAMKLNSVLED
jgi:putative sterol carrier protein